MLKCLNFNGTTEGLLDIFAGGRHAFLLDSSLADVVRGRYSVIGSDPFEIVQGSGKDTVHQLRKKYSAYQRDKHSAPIPLVDGMVGYFGYDLGLYPENIKKITVNDLHLPDAFFGFYDCLLTIDHWEKKLYISSTGLPEKDERLRKLRAQERLAYVESKLAEYLNRPARPRETTENNQAQPRFDCNFTQEAYLRAVNKALEYIRQGDIYQVNLSQRFSLEKQGHASSATEVYRLLKAMSPSCFSGFLDCGDFQIISSSPERFLKLSNGLVQTQPMKGTRPRGKNDSEDRKIRQEIFQSEKDKAELLMITDLERNDLGKVCEYGSVCVKDMRAIEAYKTVFQAVSTVEGKLRKDKDIFDLIEACFPSGSVTGCPKIRAMQVIEELEPTRRGMYTGSLGYIDFSGEADFNILIRTVLSTPSHWHFQAGGGIVADSNPLDEYNETLVKAHAMKNCLIQAHQRVQAAVC